MNELESNVVQAVEQAAPQSPAVEMADAALKTASNPNASNILADVELAVSLVKEFKDKIKGLHPSVINLIHLMFLGHL